MTEILWFFAFILCGGLALVIAMRLSYIAGQHHEESRARRYLESLSHLSKPKERNRG